MSTVSGHVDCLDEVVHLLGRAGRAGIMFLDQLYERCYPIRWGMINLADVEFEPSITAAVSVIPHGEFGEGLELDEDFEEDDDDLDLDDDEDDDDEDEDDDDLEDDEDDDDDFEEDFEDEVDDEDLAH